jgi:oligoribonuclease NrnB/cAMP/cGMP phosphodiesterase (DHH superfamily)
MKDKILFVHNDLDGCGCAVVGARVGYEIIIPVHHDEIDAKVTAAVEAGHHVTCADISPKNVPREVWNKIAVLDHHQHSTFATMKGVYGVEGRYDPDRCGTSIFLVFSDVKLSRMSAIIEAWDLWKLDSIYRKESEDWNRLFWFLGFDRFLANRIDSPEHLNSLERELSSILRERDERYIEERVRAAQDCGAYRVTTAHRCTSEIGHRLADGYEYAKVLCHENGTVSLRSIGAFDVGALAKSRGGGGHAHAAGYPMENDR